MMIHPKERPIILPALPDLEGYTWRPARKRDAPAIYQLKLDVDAVDGTTEARTLDDVVREFEDSWSKPEANSLLALTPAGQVAALAWVFANPEPSLKRRAFLWGEVHPDHRGIGLDEFILTWLEAQGRQTLDALPSDLERVLRVGCQDNLQDRIDLFEQHGFQPVRYFYKMRRDLSRSIPKAPVYEGIRLQNWSPELDEATMCAFNESFRDHWGFEPATKEDWNLWITGRDKFRGDLSFLALNGDQVVGICLCGISPEENAREGVNQGWIDEVGVLRAWRRRGLATAMMLESMRAFEAEGLDCASLGVDTENPTGALGVYERLGFVSVERFISFAKALD